MSRRKSEDSDSLELLLDTICNMFGGVLFIAMLLAILAGAKGDGIAKSAGVTSIAQASELRSRLAALQREVPALESTAAAIQPREKNESLNIGELSTRISSDLTEAEQRLAAARSTLDSINARDADFSAQAIAAEERTKQLRASNAALQDAISKEQNSKISDARLPVTRQTEKWPLHLILKNGRIYEIYGFDPVNGVFINTRDVTSRDVGKETEITPRSDAGFPPTLNLARHPRWRSIVAHRPSNRYFLYVIVYPDSFDVFRALRAEGMRQGYEYDLILMPDSKRVLLTPAADFTTQ